MSSINALTSCSSNSGATMRLISPISYARWASMKRPVNMYSAASELPTMRGRK